VDENEALHQRRQGWWLKVAREKAGITGQGAAKIAGLKGKTSSSITHWEKGRYAPSQLQLRRLAQGYGVPLSVFTDPKPTDEERLDAVIRSASDAERQDWEAEPDRAPGGDAAPGAARGRRSA